MLRGTVLCLPVLFYFRRSHGALCDIAFITPRLKKVCLSYVLFGQNARDTSWRGRITEHPRGFSRAPTSKFGHLHGIH